MAIKVICDTIDEAASVGEAFDFSQRVSFDDPFLFPDNTTILVGDEVYTDWYDEDEYDDEEEEDDEDE